MIDNMEQMKLTSVRLIAGISLLMLAGCVGRGPYRTSYPGTSAPPIAPVLNSKHEDIRVVEDHGSFKLAFVEFDESGNRQQGTKQIEAAERVIRQARGLDLRTGAVQPNTVGGLTVLYIHGWKNNARSVEGQMKDVEKFRLALERISKELDLDPAKMPITGVYIGWRGRSVNIDNALLNFWTLFPRYFVAGRVSSDEMQKTIARIFNAGAAGKGRPNHLRPRVVLLGHSLGGRVLEGAVENVQGSSLFEGIGPSQNGLVLGACVTLNNGTVTPPESPVDLVLSVNEATRSFKVRRANKLCNPPLDAKRFVRHPGYEKTFCEDSKNRNEAICKPYPLFVHIASSADWATRWLALLALGGRTAPHSVELHTHNVTEIAAVDDAPPEAVFTFETNGHNADKERHAYAVISRKPEPNRHPIWVMRVNKHVIQNHGDIWNPDFMNMLISLMGGMETVPMKNYSPAKKRVIPAR